MATKAKPAAPVEAEDAPVKLPPGFKMPKTLAQCADLLYSTQQARYVVQKQAKEMEAIEGALKNRIIQELPKSQATGIAGKMARVYVENKTVVKVNDFPAYINEVARLMKKDPGAASLLQKRVGEAAVKEVWEAGKTLKGIEAMEVPVVRMNKV